MYYTIGQVSQMFNLPVSTLRYYDKEGLFPSMERVSGIRRFSQAEIDALRVIECLKKSGLEIKDIKMFMDLCTCGSSTYPQRHEIFVKQKAAVETEMSRLRNTMDMITYKCWYYEQAMADGSEERVRSMAPEDMPDDIRAAYLRSHG